MISHINGFREKLKSGQTCLGAGITFCDPTVTEAIAGSCDFVWVDLEHNPASLETMLAHLIATRAAGVATVVRVPSGEVAWIKRVLDSGAEGIILPRAYSAQDVRDFVSACRYPPLGTRGFGPRRPSNYGRIDGEEYLKQANRDLFVVAQIETVESFRELDEIVQIEGLDSLVVGPYDLSGSMGMLGQVKHPEVLEAIRTIASKARAAGLFVGSGLGTDSDFAKTLAGLGVQWLQAGSDFEFMIRGADALFAEIRAD